MSARWTLRRVAEVISAFPRPAIVESPHTLDITLEMVRRLGLTKALNELRFIHVAGTKGKGSTSTFTANLLRSSGTRVGLFVSPHVLDIRERVTVEKDALLDEDRFLGYFDRFEADHRAALEPDAQWTKFMTERNLETVPRGGFFHFMFLFALRIFLEEAVEVVVTEVGIGGRLDPTNCIPPPVCCAVTALGFDHMELLGDTIQQIASEKAGIFKQGSTCFAAPQFEYPEAAGVLQSYAQRVGASLTFVPGAHQADSETWMRVSVRGSHMIENSQLALALARHYRRATQGPDCVVPNPLDPPTPLELEVLASSKSIGRSQIVPDPQHPNDLLWYLDGAHTPESIPMAIRWFGSVTSPDKRAHHALIFCTQRDPVKLFTSEVVSLISKNFSSIVFLHFATGKAALNEAEAAVVEKTHSAWIAAAEQYDRASKSESESRSPSVFVFQRPLPSDNSGLREMLKESCGAGVTDVLVTGSFYLVGPMLRALAL